MLELLGSSLRPAVDPVEPVVDGTLKVALCVVKTLLELSLCPENGTKVASVVSCRGIRSADTRTEALGWLESVLSLEDVVRAELRTVCCACSTTALLSCNDGTAVLTSGGANFGAELLPAPVVELVVTLVASDEEGLACSLADSVACCSSSSS